MTKKIAPRRARPIRARGAVQAVVDETIALHHWLAYVADEIYGDDARGASRRWTLRRLERDGPATVPALAKKRTVRRQTLQPLIDALANEGLIELRDNPSHARSPLIALTRAGAALAARLDRIDVAVLRAVGRGISDVDLATTAATLSKLRSRFELGMRWRPAAERAALADRR